MGSEARGKSDPAFAGESHPETEACHIPAHLAHPRRAPAQRVRTAEAPQIQAVGGHRREGATGGDGVAPPLPTARIFGCAGTQQHPLSVGLCCLLKEGTQLG